MQIVTFGHSSNSSAPYVRLTRDSALLKTISRGKYRRYTGDFSRRVG